VNRSTTAIGPPHLGQRHSGCTVGAVGASDSFFEQAKPTASSTRNTLPAEGTPGRLRFLRCVTDILQQGIHVRGRILAVITGFFQKISSIRIMLVRAH
jgi:hypothetical protein